MTHVIGIDLGTTHSLCAVFEAGGARLLPNALGSVLTPSAVGVLPSGEILVGAPARELLITHPERVATRFKRWMGTAQVVTLADQTFTPQELSSLVLQSLRDDACAALGTDVRDAVITVPAYFNEHQRAATRLAGQLAGLRVRRIVNEPTAAALTYGIARKEQDQRLLVFDMGGGTLDVTVLEVFEGILETTSTAGESRLGGEDFTDRLLAHVLERHGANLETAELHKPRLVARLRGQCEQAKQQLSADSSAEVTVPDDEGRMPDDPRVEVLRREDLESICADLIERAMAPVARALSDGEIRAEGLDQVILVGGATRMPLIRDAVARHLGQEPVCQVDPDTVVALGAAVQAGLLEDDASLEDVMMTDVCPFTLGVNISKHVGGQLRGGYYLPLIHRNTTIPVACEEIVQTTRDQQTQVKVEVFQGEGRKVESNLLLGTLEVSGIPPGPAGAEVAIRFAYDVNGLLEVEARVEQTGEKFQTLLTHNVETLSPDQIEAARTRLARLKFYPRDDLRHQQLLRFAEAAVGQIDPWRRSSLEEALDAYESALAGSDRATFDAVRGELLGVLSAVDCPFHESPDE